MDATAELGRNPVSKHHIQSEYVDEQADAGRDCQPRLTRTKFLGANVANLLARGQLNREK